MERARIETDNVDKIWALCGRSVDVYQEGVTFYTLTDTFTQAQLDSVTLEQIAVVENAVIEGQRESRFRTEVDPHYLRQVEAELTGGTPDYATCMAMKAQIRLDLPYKDG